MRKLIGLAAVAAGLLGAIPAAAADSQAFVVRATDTVGEASCEAGRCEFGIEGTYRGRPIGAGAMSGRLTLDLTRAHDNGEGGVCAPVRGRVTFGVGTADRLVLAVRGISCQDGAGNPATSAFTTLGTWTVHHGTGTLEGARGHGTMAGFEDAADQERASYFGRIKL